jgi:excisionase family DNA binding protein
MEKLLRPEELSEMLGIQLSTIYNWTHYKKIPFVKVGGCVRFKPSDIEKWLEPKEPKTREPKTKTGSMKKKNLFIDSIVEAAKREVLS